MVTTLEFHKVDNDYKLGDLTLEHPVGACRPELA